MAQDNALRAAATKIAADGNVSLLVHKDTSRRAGINTISTSRAILLINGYDTRIALS
jgi:hypothetical protein